MHMGLTEILDIIERNSWKYSYESENILLGKNPDILFTFYSILTLSGLSLQIEVRPGRVANIPYGIFPY